MAIGPDRGRPARSFCLQDLFVSKTFCLQVKSGRDARGHGMRAPLRHVRRLGGRHVSLRILLEQEALGLKGLR